MYTPTECYAKSSSNHRMRDQNGDQTGMLTRKKRGDKKDFLIYTIQRLGGLYRKPKSLGIDVSSTGTNEFSL